MHTLLQERGCKNVILDIHYDAGSGPLLQVWTQAHQEEVYGGVWDTQSGGPGVEPGPVLAGEQHPGFGTRALGYRTKECQKCRQSYFMVNF